MVVDIGEVKRHIKPKADSTLYNMRKSDLIEYVRTLEHNYNVGATFLENQAKYIESLEMVQVVRCKDCKHWKPGDSFGGDSLDDMQRIGGCLIMRLARREKDFCCEGERRTDAN